MCDYSLEALKSIDAAVGDDLVVKQPGMYGSKGFTNPAKEDCVTCVKEGALLRLEGLPADFREYELGLADGEAANGRLGLVPYSLYRDGIIFDNGAKISMQMLEGVRAHVIMTGAKNAPEDATLASPAPVAVPTYPAYTG